MKILSIFFLLFALSCTTKQPEPLSESMKREQMEVNTWAMAIVFKENEISDSSNQFQALEALRQEFIARLNTKYPEFLKGMNTNAPLAQAIELRLPVYNQLIEQRIKKQQEIELSGSPK
ncbi:MAG: hypothetical protein GC171_04255 [Terrimonas sp.]|nr:hypothetical protein [Terrimonas sp.]